MHTLPSLVGGAAALAALGAVSVDHGLMYRVSRRLDHSIYRGCTSRRAVALTFDDGPSASTPQLLQFLREEGIQATFFQSGMQVERFPQITRQVHLAGHEIGNHGYSHRPLAPQRMRRPYLPTPFFIHRELARTQKLLHDVCGSAPQLFRAPFGQRWVGLDLLRRNLGMVGVQWTVIGYDWEWPAERVARYVLDRIVPGAIVCLHDGPNDRGGDNVQELLRALHAIVPALRRQGYQFETVSELLEPVPARELAVVHQ